MTILKKKSLGVFGNNNKNAVDLMYRIKSNLIESPVLTLQLNVRLQLNQLVSCQAVVATGLRACPPRANERGREDARARCQ